MTGTTNLQGVIHGKIIELDADPALPDGQQVNVQITPREAHSQMPGALQQAFGSCAGESEELDRYVEWSRLQRKVDRPEMDP